MRKRSNPDTLAAAPYELFMLGLSLYVILAITAETILPLDDGTRKILSMADTGICVVFFGDFLRNLSKSPARGRYFFTWGWLDLLSSIPMAGPFRLGRAARIFRIVRILRGFRSVRNLSDFLLRRRAQAAFAAAALVSVLLVIFSAVAILQFEHGAAGSNIQSAQDALWWAYVTITTVGYGDRFPVTWEGRVIASILMTAGVGLFGTFTAFVASWFMAAKPADSMPMATTSTEDLVGERQDH